MLSTCTAMPQVMQRAAAHPLPRGGHQRSATGVSRPPLRPVAQDADETVPLVNGGLAAKALKGRQSIAQLQSRPHAKVCLDCLCEQCSLKHMSGRRPATVSPRVRHAIAHVKSQLQVMLRCTLHRRMWRSQRRPQLRCPSQLPRSSLPGTPPGQLKTLSRPCRSPGPSLEASWAMEVVSLPAFTQMLLLTSSLHAACACSRLSETIARLDLHR